jgi:hypothetical protein
MNDHVINIAITKEGCTEIPRTDLPHPSDLPAQEIEKAIPKEVLRGIQQCLSQVIGNRADQGTTSRNEDLQDRGANPEEIFIIAYDVGGRSKRPCLSSICATHFFDSSYLRSNQAVVLLD